MRHLKEKFKKINQLHLLIAGVMLLLLLGGLLLRYNIRHSWQSTPSLVGQVYFDGRYKIGDGDWQAIVKGEHIPSTKGDVTLQGNFYEKTPYGEDIGVFRGDLPVMLYANHIQITFYDGKVGFSTNDLENSLCGESWTAHYVTCPKEQEIEIVIHNPHKFGNETAVDELLSSLAIRDELRLYEKNVLSRGETQRNIGLVFIMGAVMLLGVALFSTLIHVKNAKIIWVLGGLILFAGLYFAYGAEGVFLWSDSLALNTTVLGASMMLYMFFFVMLVTCFLTVAQKMGYGILLFLGGANALFFLLPMVSAVLFYDLWIWWMGVQLLAGVLLAVCLVKELRGPQNHQKWVHIGAFFPLVAFAIDVVGIWRGAWKHGVVSQYVFSVLFALAIVMALKLIPHSINAAAKAKELEMEKIVLNAELAESRISTMMSQIRPHFIYNTLGSIEQLCELDPKKAGDLVHDFAKYLRGNFGELDNPKPIMMSKEMDHVHHYVSIENVRFPDMTFTFEMLSDDFPIPALTVQPIVENAIKHGLMKRSKGGVIHVVSYETPTHFCVLVEDDGVGFDTSLLLDERTHVGLRNIRERLKAMVGGSIEIESVIGVGTKVLIKIPKEAKK